MTASNALFGTYPQVSTAVLIPRCFNFLSSCRQKSAYRRHSPPDSVTHPPEFR